MVSLPRETSAQPILDQERDTPLSLHQYDQLILAFFASQETIQLEQKVDALKEKFQLEEIRAFLTYLRLMPKALVKDIEENRHHGWSHIRRVMIHSWLNRVHSKELYETPDAFLETKKFAPASALAERMHDIIQQHLNFLGFEKESKTVHGEIAAYYIMLISEEIKAVSGYADTDICRAALMCWYHSEPERITDDAELPSLSEMKEWLDRQITTKQKKIEAKQANVPSDKRKKMLPDTLLDFLPVPNGLTREILAQRMESNAFFRRPKFSSQDRTEMARNARDFAVADKMDSLMPPAEANLRSIEVFMDRALFVDMTADKALEELQKNRSNIVSKIDPKKEQNSHTAHVLAQIDDLIQQVKAYKTTHDGETILPVELDFAVRYATADLIAPDDFSRIIFEATRDYRKLTRTEFQKQKIAQSLIARLQHMVRIFSNISDTSDEYDQKIQDFFATHGAAKKAGRSSYPLERIIQIVERASAKIREMYGLDKNSENIVLNPLGNREYDPSQPQIELAAEKYIRDLRAKYEQRVRLTQRRRAN